MSTAATADIDVLHYKTEVMVLILMERAQSCLLLLVQWKESTNCYQSDH